jgi:hypothetical protein
MEVISSIMRILQAPLPVDYEKQIAAEVSTIVHPALSHITRNRERNEENLRPES